MMMPGMCMINAGSIQVVYLRLSSHCLLSLPLVTAKV